MRDSLLEGAVLPELVVEKKQSDKKAEEGANETIERLRKEQEIERKQLRELTKLIQETQIQMQEMQKQIRNSRKSQRGAGLYN